MENVIITELENGEYTGIDILEITEIPDISILINDASNEKEYIIKHKKQFETMITEFFFGCKSDFNSDFENQDYALSIVFKSEKVENQTYNANVKIYILIRGINSDRNYLNIRMQEIKKSLESSLLSFKYGIKNIDNKEEIIDSIKDIACKEKNAILKDC